MDVGAPVGNKNAVKAKRWQQAIDRALERRSKASGIEELDRLADVFLATAEDMTISTEKRGPSIAGLTELADRLDGKPHQSVAVGNPDGTNLFSEIVRVIVDTHK